MPIGLGPDLADLLAALTSEQLGQRLTALGLGVPTRKAERLQSLTGALSSRDLLGPLVGRTPLPVQKLLDELVYGNPVVEAESWSGWPARSRGAQSAEQWLLDRGLLRRLDWSAAVMARETVLALRDPSFRVTLPPRPPDAPVQPVEPQRVAGEAGSAAAGFLDGLATTLESLSAAPAATLKAGGIGVRETRRLAKAIGWSEEDLAFALTVAQAAGLVSAQDAVLPTPTFDEWRALGPGDRHAELVAAWWALPWSPGHVGEDEPKTAPLGYRHEQVGVRPLRAALIRALAALPEGKATASLPAVAASVAWQRPLAYVPQSDPHVEAVWHEARRLGVVALDAASPIGRALVLADETGAREALRDACTALLPPAASTATFQADLTAVVTGPPDPGLAELLGSAADVEARGGATVWRFSAASVRRAFDAGTTADELERRLGVVAARTPLPQPLTYLIHDVARRHGRLRVAPVASCVVSDDVALLAEVSRTQGLAALQPRLLAPTVLASAKPVEETVALLRAAGYAPVRQSESGEVVVERPVQQRAPSLGRGGPGPRGAGRAGEAAAPHPHPRRRPSWRTHC
ncbi:helicase-associated domain-containing protein [Motilibacter deserti]|uniref:Helicase-associated domain-containing protein n=1 Tax=Motilibacter deserti TaxID=2714956 RepID=A0ABX0GT32_9ACTN|nr:helicase-associated domain-containing protein [Motilibacter deserti]NHC13673.1 helicase-associated domain-containing protein [Motilibacter deserti]